MEDSKKRKAPSGTTPENGRVVDLTRQMELGAGKKARIIDLTQVIKSPPDRPAPPMDPPFARKEDSAAAAGPPPALKPETFQDAALPVEPPPITPPAAPADDAVLPLNPMAQPQRSAAATAIEQELELNIEELACDIFKEEPSALRSAAAGAQNSDSGTDRSDGAETPGADTIELTEVVCPQEAAAAQEAEPPAGQSPLFEATPGADTIELTDVVFAHEVEEEEEIIELTDIVTPGDGPAESIDLADITFTADTADAFLENANSMQPMEEEDVVEPAYTSDAHEAVTGGEEEIIELTDIVGTSDGVPEMEEVIELTDIVEGPVSEEEDVIDLIDRVETEKTPEPAQEDELFRGIEEAFAKVAKSMATGGRDAVEERPCGSGSAAVSEKDIEKAIEKILRTKYAQTIESMIASVVEKVVTREMENIKRNLLADEE